MEEKEKLPIFENCPSLNYVVMGFTSQDLAYTAIVAIIGIVIGICMATIGNNIVGGVLIGLIVSAVGIIFFRRDRYMENCVDKIRLVYKYHHTQKQYEYRYVNIYEKIEKG